MTPLVSGRAAAAHELLQGQRRVLARRQVQKSGRPLRLSQSSPARDEPLRRVSCNDLPRLHTRTTNERQLRRRSTTRTGRPTIKTAHEDNTLCLCCHATHGPFANVTKAMVADYAEERGGDRQGHRRALAPPVRARADHGPQPLHRLPHVGDRDRRSLMARRRPRDDAQVPGQGRHAELLRGRLPQRPRQHLRPRHQGHGDDVGQQVRQGPRDDPPEVLRQRRHVVGHEGRAPRATPQPAK